MKQIDFEHGKITDNILRASIPMLVAEVLSLLYNIVDRIYIARIIVMIGKHSPTAPSAVVPTSGILAI